MAFIINRIQSGQTPKTIAEAIGAVMQSGGRFTARIVTTEKTVSIHDVRLTYKKDYCGNHPLPCPVRPGGHKPHKHLPFLEGADWVGFNDMVNDVLDSLGCICNCASSLVIIRKQGQRCTMYDAQPQGFFNNEWVKDSGAFENCIGLGSQRAAYPDGTPGFATYTGQPNYSE